jgi:hypothetical protein
MDTMKLTVAKGCAILMLLHSAACLAEASLSPAQIFQNSKSSVVMIVGSDREAKETIQGSGFVVAQNRIVTNHHVAADMAAAVAVFSDGTTSAILSVALDNPAADLVVLQAETNKVVPLRLGDESTLQQGDPVLAIGAPKGLQLSLTNGIVSSFRSIDGQFLIQTTAAISHGSSGGPLFDDQGRVVGITSAFFADAPGIYLSVSVGDLKRLLRTPQSPSVSLSEWSSHLSNPVQSIARSAQPSQNPVQPPPNPVRSSANSHEGWDTGKLTSWKAAKDEERTFFISSDSYVYGVTHALGARSIYWAAAIGARNPLNSLPLGAEIQFRTQGRFMYILVHNKETMYSIDTATPRR